MTPAAITDAPMDLSMKTRRKLRLEEFLRQNLDQAPAGRVIQWVDRDRGIFRILWTHQSSGAFTQEDAALFRYWALARGKPASLSSVELKQSLRMALNKSPSVERLSATHDEYRYFKFTEWGSRRSSGTKRPRSPEDVRKKSSTCNKPPPLLPITSYTGEESSRPAGWKADCSLFLQQSEGFQVPTGKESQAGLTGLHHRSSPMFQWLGSDHLTGGGVREPILREQMLGKQLLGEQLLARQLRGEQLSTERQLSELSTREHFLEKKFNRGYVSEEQLPGDRSLGNLMIGEHLGYFPKTHSPQAYIETREALHSVPSFRDSYSRLDSENFLSLYSDACGYPQLVPHYDHTATSSSYHSVYESLPTAKDYYKDVRHLYSDVRYPNETL
ncbi:uncharacterized protein LOC121872554 [Homarus americanus]|nr:uncharacterized protein LOC121872554 [Homarus americanus]